MEYLKHVMKVVKYVMDPLNVIVLSVQTIYNLYYMEIIWYVKKQYNALKDAPKKRKFYTKIIKLEYK